MVIATKAIVLKKLRYSDHSYIVHLFTESHGHLTTSININSRNRRISSGLLPLSIIETELNFHPNKPVQQLKNLSINHTFQSIPFHPVKSALAQFLSEVYFECIKTELQNHTLFQFIESSIKILDIIEENITVFHLKNMLELTRIMGFKPSDNFANESPFLHFREGNFTSFKSSETSDEIAGKNIAHLLNVNDETFTSKRIEIKNIGDTLDTIITYYTYHLSTFKKPKSINVFKMLI